MTMYRPAIHDMFDYYTAIKASLVVDNEMPSDAPTMVQLGETDLTEESFTREYALDEPGDIALAVLQDADLFLTFMGDWIASRGAPAWIAVCNDVYALGSTSSNQLTAEQLSWNLEEQFHLGNPLVKEAITITAADHHGDLYLAERTYVVDDDRGIIFDELEELDAETHFERSFITATCRKVTSMYGWTLEQIILDFWMRDRQN